MDAPTIHHCPDCGEQPELITAPWGVTIVCCGLSARRTCPGALGPDVARSEAIRAWNEQATELCDGIILQPGHASREQDAIANGTEVACPACTEVA